MLSQINIYLPAPFYIYRGFVSTEPDAEISIAKSSEDNI